MDYELPYPEAGYELALSEREKYLSGLEELSGAEDSRKILESLASIYDILRGSQTPFGREAEWAVDLIRCYRNLGSIVKQVSETGYNLLSEEDKEKREEELEQKEEEIAKRDEEIADLKDEIEGYASIIRDV